MLDLSKKYYTVSDYAFITGVSRYTLYDHIKKGQIKYTDSNKKMYIENNYMYDLFRINEKYRVDCTFMELKDESKHSPCSLAPFQLHEFLIIICTVIDHEPNIIFDKIQYKLNVGNDTIEIFSIDIQHKQNIKKNDDVLYDYARQLYNIFKEKFNLYFPISIYGYYALSQQDRQENL